MKKIYLALSVWGACTGFAHAQSSSVTLYGILDAGVLYTSNVGGHSLWQAVSGNQQGARWGFKVVEDLGGGLTAISQLENGFNIFNGTASQGGREFGRQAWVGLSSSHLGTLSAGRQYNPMQDMLSPLQISGTNVTAFGAHPFDNDNFINTFRTDNSIKYTSPSYAGFSVEAMYAFSNSASFAVNRAYSVGARYAAGNVKLATAYVRMSAPAFNKDLNGAIPADSFYSLSATPFLATASTIQQWGAGGTYDIGAATLGVLYTGTLFENPTTGSLFSGATGSGGGTGSVRFQNIEGSVSYRFTTFLIGAVAETYTNAAEGSSSGNYWQTSTTLQYFLSKRTNLYASTLYQKTSRNLNATIVLTGAPSTSSTQVAALIGIRHKF